MAGASSNGTARAGLGAGRKALLLVIPWLFLALLAGVAWQLILPAVQHGAVLGYLFGALFLLVFGSFGAAAVTMSRRLLAGRYP